MEHNNPISLKSCVSRRKRRITVLNNSILQNWKSLWISSTNNSSIIDFQEVVEANYKLFQAEAKYNQSKNFKEKENSTSGQNRFFSYWTALNLYICIQERYRLY